MTDSRWQLLREWPPGYGGIERVAHEMATFWRAPVFSLDAQNLSRVAHQDGSEPLPVCSFLEPVPDPAFACATARSPSLSRSVVDFAFSAMLSAKTHR